MALEETELEQVEREPASKSPVFWSSDMQVSDGAGRTNDVAESIPVPLGLRDLQKCKACGFPVSQGRTFCVECEEKQWRGQRLPQLGASAGAAGQELHPAQASIPIVEPKADTPAVAVSAVADVPQTNSHDGAEVEIMNSAAPSESWFAANRYVLGALLVAALVLGAIVWLR
jgi:hypothetical protein